jgi:hypothetical protein
LLLEKVAEQGEAFRRQRMRGGNYFPVFLILALLIIIS